MKVFISHASTDAQLAQRVADDLRKNGFQVWDETQVLPGENWAAKLAEALQESEAMVVLLTPDSVRSPNINYDVGYALGQQKYKGRVIPVIAAPSEKKILAETPWILKKFNVISAPNLEKDDRNLKEITQALKAVFI